MINLYNIGFTQKSAEEFFGILNDNKIDCLVDIRLNPNGQLSRFAFKKDLPFFLDRLVSGCKYFHRPDLAPDKKLLKQVRDRNDPMSKDYTLFEKQFNVQIREQSYIDDFVKSYSQYKNVVLLCSEPTVRKCHRRLISQLLLEIFPDQIRLGGNL